MFKSLFVIFSLLLFTFEITSGALHDHPPHESTKDNCSVCSVINHSSNVLVASDLLPELTKPALIGFKYDISTYSHLYSCQSISSAQARAPPIS